MNKRTSLVLLLLLQSCNISTSLPRSEAAACPDTPKSFLRKEDTELVNLNQSKIETSGQVSQGRPRGYTFEGKADQTLSYSTDEEVCVWIYAPDNSLLSSNKLTLDGKYLLQVSALQGSTSYALDLGLSDPTRPQTRASSSGSANNSSSNAGSSSASTKAKPDKKPAAKSVAKAECGSPKPTKSERRYRVVAVNSGSVLSDIKSDHCKDAYVRRDGLIQIASFSSERGAQSFISEKKAAVGGSWDIEPYDFKY